MEFKTKDSGPVVVTIQVDPHECASGRFTTENGAKVEYLYSPTDVKLSIDGWYFSILDLISLRNFVDYSIKRLEGINMNNLKQKTLEQLKELRDQILVRNAFWKSSQDGSYEMALHMAGYGAVLDEIRLKEQDGNKG